MSHCFLRCKTWRVCQRQAPGAGPGGALGNVSGSSYGCSTSGHHIHIPGRKRRGRVKYVFLDIFAFSFKKGNLPQDLLPSSHWPELGHMPTGSCKGS